MYAGTEKNVVFTTSGGSDLEMILSEFVHVLQTFTEGRVFLIGQFVHWTDVLEMGK